MAKTTPIKLVLQDGTEFLGNAFGYGCDAVVGELVFDSSMVGYQEVITNPAYLNKIVLLTYPLIGNTGIVNEDFDLKGVTVKGIIVREHNDTPSNFRYTETLQEVLEEGKVVGLTDVDTRAISKSIYKNGNMVSAIVPASTDTKTALSLIKNYKEPNLTEAITCKKTRYYRTSNHTTDIVAIDLGIKQSTIKTLNKLGANLTLVPANTSVEEIKSLRPDAIYLSGGPEEQNNDAITETVKSLIGFCPIASEGIGAQILAKAFGVKVVKLKAGHHGSNHPVKNLTTLNLETQSQSHDYTLCEDSFEKANVSITAKNVLDGSIESFASNEHKVLGVLFNPSLSTKEGQNFYNTFFSFIKGE